MRLLIAALLFVLSFNVHAKNPGEGAQSCVNASSSGGKVTFTNNCGVKVFVLWCGDLSYSKKKCGDGPKGGHYTQSANIDVGDESVATVKGHYEYNACKGSIGFGNDGYYEDSSSGAVRCLAR
ncbi:MAG: hypothetical protein V4857_03825 [Pseudomonadota bacterium]